MTLVAVDVSGDRNFSASAVQAAWNDCESTSGAKYSMLLMGDGTEKLPKIIDCASSGARAKASNIMTSGRSSDAVESSNWRTVWADSLHSWQEHTPARYVTRANSLSGDPDKILQQG
jgi:hypothetical protein